MSQIIQRQQGTTFLPIVQQSPTGSPASIKQLPSSIIQSISEFGSKPVNFQRVSKEWRELFSNDPILDLHNSKITDKELIEIIERRKNVLTGISVYGCEKLTNESLKYISKLQNLESLELTGCKNITDEGVKYLSSLINLKTLCLRGYKKVTDDGLSNLTGLIKLESLNVDGWKLIGGELKRTLIIQLPNLKSFVAGPCRIDRLDAVRSMISEKMAFEQMNNEKSKKFGISDPYTLRCKDQTVMQTNTKTYEINFHPFFLLSSEAIDSFLLKNPEAQDGIKQFLTEKDPFLLDIPAWNLIRMFNCDLKDEYNKIYTDNGIFHIQLSKINYRVAKEILIMHALGKLDAFKRFAFTHELGHARDHIKGTKSLGEFNPLEFTFIKPHEYGEVRADLTAARDENAYEIGITYFEWVNILLKGVLVDENDPHPTCANRVKALQIDHEKILKEKTESVNSTV